MEQRHLQMSLGILQLNEPSQSARSCLEQDVEGARLRAWERGSASERERASRSCDLTFQCRVRLILHHARGAVSGASGWECTD